MSSEEALMETFESNIDNMNLSDEFKDIIVVCYQDLLDQCLDLELQLILTLFPSEEQLMGLQIAYQQDMLIGICEQSNMYCIAALIEAGFEVADFTHILYMLERGMEYSSENDDRCFSFYIPISIFLLAAIGVSESTHRITEATASTNVVAIKSRNTKLIEQAWASIQDALIDILEGLTPVYLEIMSNAKNNAFEKGNVI